VKPVLTNVINCKFRIITPWDASYTPRILWIRNCIGANDKQPILFFPTGSVIKLFAVYFFLEYFNVFVIQDLAVPQPWHLFYWSYYVHNSHFCNFFRKRIQWTHNGKVATLWSVRPFPKLLKEFLFHLTRRTCPLKPPKRLRSAL